MSLYCPECNETYSDESMSVCPDDGTRLYVLADDEDDPLIGAVIDGRFRVDHTLGIGGMGTVYRGAQLSVNRPVAIKVLRTELSSREVALERFFREAKTISQLSHPNIVHLIDFGQDRDRGLLYLVMELVNGHNLADMIGDGRLRMALALDVVYQVCGALTEPHARGVIHRDLKPDNLVLVPISDGTVQTKVLDFGIARVLESNTQLTGTGMICGTPAYMAPEQAQNEQLDPRTDLYALGVILYEMLSGWPPFGGTSSLQIMLQHIQEMPVPLRDLLPPATLPPDLENLVYDLMSKTRDERPTSAREVRDRIDHLRQTLSLDAVRVDAGADANSVFVDWTLQKLPRGEENKSGPTEVLRRETGMEQWMTSIDDDRPTDVFGPSTETDMAVRPTDKMTPDQKKEVLGDAEKVKVPTRKGAQQGWTPGDQEAVARIKGTREGLEKKGSAVFPPDYATPVADIDAVGDDGSTPRKTMIEPDRAESRDEPRDTPETESHDSARQAVIKPDGETAERDSAEPSNGLVVLAVFLCGLAVIVAGWVAWKLYEQETTSTSVVEVDPVEVDPIGGSEEAETPAPPAAAEKLGPDPSGVAGRVAAKERALTRVERAREEGTEAAEEEARRARVASARGEPEKSKPVERPESSKRKSSAPEKRGDGGKTDTPPFAAPELDRPEEKDDQVEKSKPIDDPDSIVESVLDGMAE